MLFWSLFIFSCLVCYILEKSIVKKHKVYLHFVFFTMLVFLSAFRYNIGGDYQSYVFYFENIGIRDFIFEPSFLFILELLDNCGFTSQMVFVVYTLFAFPFVFLGIKYFNTKNFMLGLVLFSIIPTLYWRSFGFIRQFVAVAIIFWGAKYIVERNLPKYILIVAAATIFHSSAIFMLPLYFIVHLNFKKSIYFFSMLIAVLAYELNLVTTILFVVLDNMGLGYIRYLDLTDGGGLINALALIPYYLFWLIIVIAKGKFITDLRTNVALNMVTIGLLLQIVTFDVGAIRRITFFFDIFRCVLFALIPYYFTKGMRIASSILLILIFSLIFLLQIYVLSQGGHQDGVERQIEYQFNFDLVQ